MEQAAERSERALASVMERLIRIGFLIGAFGGLAFGVWMIADPAGWYELVPGPASDYGAYNAHFIRDVGGWYVASGILFLFAATNPRRFGGVTLIVALIANGIHAASHVAALISGQVGVEHWATDLPLVLIPVVFLGLMLWVSWSLQSEPNPPAVGAGPEEQD